MNKQTEPKTILIVVAHPEPRSFNGSWAEQTKAAAQALGHRALVSDLVSMGFDAVESAKHYSHHQTDLPFDPLKAQEVHAKANTLPEDVLAEVDKVLQADWVIFHFPLWWFAPPAVLKGWFDRVLVHGKLHTVDERFNNGLCRNKKALFCVTTGASSTECAFNGKEGDVRMLLWPSAYTLHYVGFTVFEPEVVHGVHAYHSGSELKELNSRLQHVLSNQKLLISNFEKRQEIKFNNDSDFDKYGRLKSDRKSYSYFIRHGLDDDDGTRDK